MSCDDNRITFDSILWYINYFTKEGVLDDDDRHFYMMAFLSSGEIPALLFPLLLKALKKLDFDGSNFIYKGKVVSDFNSDTEDVMIKVVEDYIETFQEVKERIKEVNIGEKLAIKRESD
jgi:hypothetical protein